MPAHTEQVALGAGREVGRQTAADEEITNPSDLPGIRRHLWAIEVPSDEPALNSRIYREMFSKAVLTAIPSVNAKRAGCERTEPGRWSTTSRS